MSGQVFASCSLKKATAVGQVALVGVGRAGLAVEDVLADDVHRLGAVLPRALGAGVARVRAPHGDRQR